MEEDVACSGFFNASVADTVSCLDAFQASGWLQFSVTLKYSIISATPNAPEPVVMVSFVNSPMDDVAVKEALMRFIYHGGIGRVLLCNLDDSSL
jgi:hypothetical protein